MKNLLIKYRKWLSVAIYMLCVLIIGLLRNTLIYSHLSDRLSSNIYDVLFMFLAVAGLVGIVYLCTSPFQKRDFRQLCEAVELKNGSDKYARLVSVCNDPNKKHGKIYRVRNYHISMDDFDQKLTKSANKFCICAMEFNRNASQTILYVLPRKYVKPTIISPDDEAIGSKSIRNWENLLIVGATGTGKTTATKILIEKIVKFQPDAKIWILDYKNADFRAFKNCPHYYSYMDCVQGLNDYYSAYKEQQSTGIAGVPNYLVFDEWASFILSITDKKQRDLLKERASELIMTGRSYLYIPLFGQQVAMSDLYPSGARANFKMILSMGNTSKEQKTMLFSGYKEQMTENNKTGEGYLLIDGQPQLERVKFEVKDFNKLDEYIISKLQR